MCAGKWVEDNINGIYLETIYIAPLTKVEKFLPELGILSVGLLPPPRPQSLPASTDLPSTTSHEETEAGPAPSTEKLAPKGETEKAKVQIKKKPARKYKMQTAKTLQKKLQEARQLMEQGWMPRIRKRGGKERMSVYSPAKDPKTGKRPEKYIGTCDENLKRLVKEFRIKVK